MKKLLLAALATLALGACVEVPECGQPGGRPWCAGGQAPAFIEDENGWSAVIATCDDRWVYRCEVTASGRSGNTGGYMDESQGAVCDGEDVVCETGSPMCVSIPCDGEVYFGNGHSRELP